MNRRNLLTAIAAIPLIGRIVPASALALPKRKRASLGAYRDLLMPGLWGACGEENGALYDPVLRPDANIIVDYDNDRLLIRVISEDQKKWATGIISWEDIETDIYKYKFMPLLRKLRETITAAGEYVHMSEVKAESWK